MNSIRNIFIVGETGVGKSSLCNLLLLKEFAEVGDAAVGLTVEIQWDKIMYDGKIFKFYDCPGLSEATHGAAINAEKLIETKVREQYKVGGVSAFLMVIKKGIIGKSVLDAFKYLKNLRENIGIKFPIIAVITHYDFEPNRNTEISWHNTFKNKGIEFSRIIAACAAPLNNDDVIATRRDVTRAEILEVLSINAVVPDNTGDKLPIFEKEGKLEKVLNIIVPLLLEQIRQPELKQYVPVVVKFLKVPSRFFLALTVVVLSLTFYYYYFQK